MPPPSRGYVLKSPLPSLDQLYSVLEGREQLKEQLEVIQEADFELDRYSAKI